MKRSWRQVDSRRGFIVGMGRQARLKGEGGGGWICAIVQFQLREKEMQICNSCEVVEKENRQLVFEKSLAKCCHDLAYIQRTIAPELKIKGDHFTC